MAFTLALDLERNDLQIDSRGNFRYVYGPDEVKQRIIVSLQHSWQEYFLNVYSGVPWYESILGSKDLRTVELIIRREVLNVPGVISVVKSTCEWDLTDRRKVNIYIMAEVTAYEGTVNSQAIEIEAIALDNRFAYENVPFAQYNWFFAK
jgi:hypothetical protein